MSPAALTVKGLIKLAASAVKCREGNAPGAVRHAVRAAELLAESPDSDLFESCNLSAAQSAAAQLATSPPPNHAPASDRPVSLPGLRV